VPSRTPFPQMTQEVPMHPNVQLSKSVEFSPSVAHCRRSVPEQ
jgi:hypothetical protein